MRNLARINNYCNTQQSWRDWLELTKQAHMAGLSNLVQKHKPRSNAGWRRIDKAIAALRAEMTYADALKIIRGVCREIGCSGMSQSCESRPHDCKIIQMLCGRAEEK